MTPSHSDEPKNRWYWPDEEELNDFPDPLGIEDQWMEWPATMADGPSAFAEIFSREYIQNSWDSIQKKAKLLTGDDELLRPMLTFHFVELKAGDALKFVEAFGLNEHVARLKAMDDSRLKDNRLGDAGERLKNEQTATVRLLVAVESLAEGMPGWKRIGKGPPAQMRIALIQSVTGKQTQGGTGGSWGEGKKAVAAASQLRTLAAYTCHPPALESDDPGATRRFLGVTYWRPHESATKVHRGLGVLGALPPTPGADFRAFEPLKDEASDKLVEALGVPHFGVRDPLKISDHGTSYLFVDPAFEPEELAWAISRNWWPLLESHQLEIAVHDYAGKRIELVTKDDPNLAPFIRAFDIARKADEPKEPSELRAKVTARQIESGTVAIISDISDDGWSYDQLDNGNHDLVALVRNDMVIAYQRFPRRNSRSAPYVRGTFIVNTKNEAGNILKMTEGHLHNAWKEKEQEVGDAEYAKFATAVLDGLAEQTKTLRDRIKTSDEAADVRIKAFEKIFTSKGPSKGPSGGGGGNKPPGSRPFSIRYPVPPTRDFDPSDPTKLRFNRVVEISLRPDFPLDELEATIDLGWKVFEDSGPARDNSLTDLEEIELPTGFVLADSVATGILTKAPVTFRWSSQYFSDDWQVVSDPDVNQADVGGPK